MALAGRHTTSPGAGRQAGRAEVLPAMGPGAPPFPAHESTALAPTPHSGTAEARDGRAAEHTLGDSDALGLGTARCHPPPSRLGAPSCTGPRQGEAHSDVPLHSRDAPHTTAKCLHLLPTVSKTRHNELSVLC